MKDVSKFTAEEIKRYKIITPEQAQAEIDILLTEKRLIEERVSRIKCVTPDTIFIERIDYRERGQTIVTNDRRIDFRVDGQKNMNRNEIGGGKEDRISNSCSARVLKISDVSYKNNESEDAVIKANVKVGDYLHINAAAPYCPNLLDFKYGGKYDDLYKAIWIINPGNILMFDEEQNANDYYDLRKKGIEKRQESSVENALFLIETKNENNETFDRSELRTGLFDDGKTSTVFKGLPTQKFHERS